MDIFEKYYCIMWYLGMFYIIKEKKGVFTYQEWQKILY